MLTKPSEDNKIDEFKLNPQSSIHIRVLLWSVSLHSFFVREKKVEKKKDEEWEEGKRRENSSNWQQYGLEEAQAWLKSTFTASQWILLPICHCHLGEQ